MRYVTHQFAHPETLDRARKWLLQLGFDASHIESQSQGIPRITLLVEPAQVTEVQMVLNACELTDPDGWPSFWDLSGKPHPSPVTTETFASPPIPPPGSSAVGWHPQDRW